VKSKSIGSLIALAILAPSCGGSGGGGGSSGPKNAPNLVQWQTQQRSPTSSDLRDVIFANSSQGIVVGKDGAFFRTNDGGDTWIQQEIVPPTLGSNNTAISGNGATLVAVGTDLSNGLGRSYIGTNASFWTTDPNAIPAGLGNGLVGEYYNELYFRSYAETRANEGLNFNWPSGPGGSVNSSPFSVRWRGQIETPTVATETFTFTAATIAAADTAILEINGVVVFNGMGPQSGTFSMAPGNRYNFVFEFLHPSPGAITIDLQWSSASTTVADVPKSRLWTGAPYTDVDAASDGDYWMLRSDGTIDYNYFGTVGSFSTLDLTPPPPAAGSHIPPSQPIDWQEANGILFIGNSLTGMVCGRDNGWVGYPADTPIPPGYPASPAHSPQGQVIVTNDNGSSWTIATINMTGTKTFRRMWLQTNKYGAYHGYLIGDDVNDHGIMLATDPTVASPKFDQVQGTNVPTTAPSFRALCFPSDTCGYVVGDAGTIYRVTDDGGVVDTSTTPATYKYTYTWTLMNSGTTQNLYGVFFVDNDHGYAVGDKGTVLKISNGSTGTLWTTVSRGTPLINFNAASFTDDGVKGIAVGDGGAIVRTLDGGLHWTDMSSGAITDQLLGAAVPPGGLGTYAFACGANNSILRNSDVWGLGTWTKVASGSISGVTGTVTYRSILFPQTEVNGICVGTQNGVGVVLRTTNSGAAWAPPLTNPTLPSASYYGLVLNAPGNTVYASGGSNGKVSQSSDLATSWNVWADASPAFPSSLTLNSIAAPEGALTKLFVAASDGKVWALSSGTTPTWSQRPSTWAAAIPQSLGFQADSNGLVVTNLGGIYSTIDGGMNWAASTIHTQDTPRALWISRTVPGLAYVVANNGTILKTTTLGR
jgi:photosystem II stability/assembly factor-like uncharacterized protein